jgi:hypothetical protein
MAKRNKIGLLGLSNTTLLLIGGGIALYFLHKQSKNNSIGAIRKKKLLGKGKQHIVYEFEKNPDKVIKQVWDVEEGINRYNPNANIVVTNIDKEYMDFFIKYPDIFAKVYKVTKKYAIIEKLNTKKVLDDEYYLYNQIKDFDYWEFQYTTESDFISQLYFSITREKRFSNVILGDLIKRGDDIYLIDKYITFFNKINKTLLKKIDLRFRLDIGSHNIGYDKNGDLKLLDF